jgi:hypothetical protein
MSSLYWVAAIVLAMSLAAIPGTRGNVRVVYSIGVAATIVALLSAAAGAIAPSNPVLIVLFAVGTVACGYAGFITVFTERARNRK